MPSALNHLESTLSIVEEGMYLLSLTSSFSADSVLLSTFHASISHCIRMLQYGRNDCTTPPVFIQSFTLYSREAHDFIEFRNS